MILTDIQKFIFAIIYDITFTLIIYGWFILYGFGLVKSSPLFAFIVSLSQNIYILISLAINKKININNIFRYLMILVILKVMPILGFIVTNNFKITFTDVFYSFYLYIIYIVIIIILVEVFKAKYNVSNILYNDLTGERYQHEYSTKIFDAVMDYSKNKYDEIIKKIV
jgi:hypothetical protein